MLCRLLGSQLLFFSLFSYYLIRRISFIEEIRANVSFVNESVEMHLYILTRTVNIDVSEITLQDGHIPRISSHPGLKDDLDINVDPAVWFKVLVIDAISIDCNQRRISWNSVPDIALDFKGNDSEIEVSNSYCSSGDSSPLEDVSQLAKSVSDLPFDCSEFYACDRDLDEVFDTVPTLVSNYQSNTLSREEFHKQLMHLLHDYILPSIKLGCKDIDSVSKSLKQQDRLLQEVDGRILALSENLQKRQNDRKEQRTKFIGEILSFSSVKNPPYPRDLVSVLVNDVAGDVSEAYERLEKVQKEVDHYKTLPLNSFDPSILQMQRSRRDELCCKYENLIAVREKLREMQNSKESFAKKLMKPFKGFCDIHQEIPLCEVYLWLTEGEKEKVSEIRTVTDKKLLMLSVKEAMRTTLNELLKDKETFGVDADATQSLKATNVLGSLAASNTWQTLAEQVAKIITDAQHALAESHSRFCAEVNGRCLRLIEEGALLKNLSSQGTLCIRGSGLSSNYAENLTSDSNLEIANSKYAQRQSSADDWMTRDGAVVDVNSRRNSALSENSCYSEHSKHDFAQNMRVKNKESIHSELTMTCETSVGDVQSQPDAKTKKKKIKRLSKFTKSTFHSYIDHQQQTGSYEIHNGPSASYQRDDLSNSRREIEALQELIRRHFDNICKELQQELQLTQPRYFRKIWLNYESHFYQDTIENITQLYHLEYNSITEALCKSIKTLTVTHLSLDDALISHMLLDVDETERSMSGEDLSSVTRPSEQSFPEIPGENDVKLVRYKPRASPEHMLTRQSAGPSLEISSSEKCSAAVSEDADHMVGPDSSICALRRCLSVLPQHPKSVRRSLDVQYPKSGVIVYERTLCPVRNSVLVEGTALAETGVDPSSPAESNLSHPRLNSTSSGLSDAELNLCHSKLVAMKPRYKKQFALAFRCINVAIATRCLSAKFQHLTKCLREVTHQTSIFYQELYGRSVRACSDELMDALVILLCNVEGPVFSQLYCQIMMLADIMPPFFDGSPFSFALVQFVGACQFIQERILLKKNQNSKNIRPR